MEVTEIARIDESGNPLEVLEALLSENDWAMTALPTTS